MKYQLRFDKENCVGCYACYVICQDVHNEALEDGMNSRRVIRQAKEKGYEKKICLGCIHCGKCMEVCPRQAIYREKETGFVLVEQEKCIGCKKCEKVCPVGVIYFGKNGKMEKCDGCTARIREGRRPACEQVCCTGAIKLILSE